MKTIKSALLSLLGMGLMMSCSDQNLEPATPSQPSNEVTKDGIFVSLTINQRNTRTETDYADKMESEVGKDYENEITSAYIILADDDDNVLAYTLVKDIDSKEDAYKEYAVEGTFNRKDILSFMGNDEDLEEDKEGNKGKYVRVYVVANPAGNVSSPKVGSSIQQVINLNDANDINLYGSKVYDQSGTATDSYHFLMTNADCLSTDAEREKEIYKVFISYDKANTGYIKQDEDGKVDPTDILDLGSVSVQRNLARFDLNDENEVFFFDNNGQYMAGSTNKIAGQAPDGWKVMISMEYVGLVNVSKTFNLFKHTGLPGTPENDNNSYLVSSYDPDNSGLIWSEMPSDKRVVFDPKYKEKVHELAYWDNGINNGLNGNYTNYFLNHYLTPSTFTDIDNYDSKSADGTQKYGKIFTYYRHENHSNQLEANETSDKTAEKGFYIRRYCPPNTIHDAENQKAGISTGFVFIARLNFAGGLGYGTERGNESPVFAWGGRFYGANYNLQGKVNNPSDAIDEAMKEAYEKAIKSATAEDENWKNASEESKNLTLGNQNDWTPEQKAKNQEILEKYISPKPSKALAAALVENGFSIYLPYNISDDDDNTESKEYMCYYIYWNRHNDNGIEVGPNRMGNMEFGVVRNNIYKIKLTELTTFGHPFPDEDKDYPVDPDPINPNDPDENADKTYMKVEVKVVDWTVRRSGDIKF